MNIFVKFGFQMLDEEFFWNKVVFLNLNYIVVVDGIVQFCQCYVQFVYFENN